MKKNNREAFIMDHEVNPGEMISWAMHEKEMTRMETANKRWFISFLIVLVMLFATNVGWVIYESQFQDIIITQEADSGDGGTAQNYGTGIGDLNYGEGKTDDQNSGQ